LGPDGFWAVLVDGHTSAVALQENIVAPGGCGVCDGAHRLDVMKKDCANDGGCERNHNRCLNPSFARSIVGHMQKALDGNNKPMTAKEAVSRNETRATCPECKEPVRLHQEGRHRRGRAHFEHLPGKKKCSLRAYLVSLG